jgi:hypothetical protein
MTHPPEPRIEPDEVYEPDEDEHSNDWNDPDDDGDAAYDREVDEEKR